MAKKKSSTRPSRSSKQKSVAANQEGERINKVLAQAGFGSRREVEELVVQGRVEVDRETITKLSTRVDPSKQKIKVDGVPLKKQKLVYFALNKPPGVLSTNRDPSGRLRVIDFVPASERVFSVGRLDRSSEGLILLTNDGSLAQRLAHPKYRIQKSYFVVVAGTMTNDELAGLRKGVHLAEGFARIDGARIRRTRKGCTELEIVLSEGKNREIRRILARAGHKVVLLRRIAIGTLRLGQIPVGAARALNSNEVKSLFALTTPSNKPTKTASAKPGASTAKKPKKKSAKPKSNVAEDGMDDEFITPSFDEHGADDWEIQGDGFDGTIDGDFAEEFDGNFEGDLPSLGDTPAEEFAYDDDFVAGFDFASAQGSVIGGEEEPSPPKRRSSRQSGSSKRPARASGSKATSRSSSSRTPAGTRSGGKRSGTAKPQSGRSGSSAGRGTSAGRSTSGGRSGAAGGRSTSKPKSGAPKSSGGRKTASPKAKTSRQGASSRRAGGKGGPPKGKPGRSPKGRRR